MQPSAIIDAEAVLICGSDRLVGRVAERLEQDGRAVVSVHNADPETIRTGWKHSASPSAIVLCDENDVSNVHDALALREIFPEARIVVRMFNTKISKQIGDLVGNCVPLSTTKIAAGPLVDLAVGPGGPDRGPRRSGPFRRMANAVRGSHGLAVARTLWKRNLFRLLLVVIALIALAQTFLVWYLTDQTPLESFYDALQATLTVGFVETGVHGSSLAQENVLVGVSAISLMALDAIIVAVLFGLIADALVGERFARVFGGSARRASGHVVVAGLGTVGYRVCRELTNRGYACMAIEANPDSPFVPAARRLGVGVVIADVRQDEEFAALGLDRVVAFIAATDDDAANLEAGLTASAISDDLQIVLRMFDSQLAAKLEATPGIHACRSVTRLAAPSFAAAALSS